MGDDTVTEHSGKKVYGNGRHRDPVRSRHTYAAWRWGHRWVVVAVLVSGRARHWALPMLVALHRTRAESERLGRRHKTVSGLIHQLWAVLMGWFSERSFILTVEGAYATQRIVSTYTGRRACISLRRPCYGVRRDEGHPTIIHGYHTGYRERQRDEQSNLADRRVVDIGLATKHEQKNWGVKERTVIICWDDNEPEDPAATGALPTCDD